MEVLSFARRFVSNVDECSAPTDCRRWQNTNNTKWVLSPVGW